MRGLDVCDVLRRELRLRGRQFFFGDLDVFDGNDADLEALLVLVLELDDAVDERVDRVVGAEPDVFARVPLGAALTDDDVARDHELTAELLDSAVLRIGSTTVA